MLKKAFLVNISGILVSRVLGFVRDVSQAYVLGASIYSDIFLLAFKFPNVFRRIFAEGAFSQSFLPHFISSSKKSVFSVGVFIAFSVFIGTFSIFIGIFSSSVTRIIGLGYDKQIIELASPIVAINFWYLLFIFWVTYFSTLLQYKSIFWVNAYNSSLLNIFMVLAVFLAYFKKVELLEVVYFLSYGVLLGGAAQVLLHFYPLYRAGFFKLFYVGFKGFKKFKLYFKKDIKSFFKGFFPAMLGSSSAQIASMIDTILVTFLPLAGGLSILSYSNRIFQLPLGLFAIAISSALFPMIARALKNGEIARATSLMQKSFFFLLIVLSACTLGGIMLSKEIVWLIFERGAFSRDDTLKVALAFCGYIVGLLPFGLSRIFSLWLYSLNKQGKAALISLISLIFGLICSLILMWDYSTFGLALSASLGGILLFILTIKEFGVKKFLNIISIKSYWLMLVFILIVEYAVLKLFLHFFHI